MGTIIEKSNALQHIPLRKPYDEWNLTIAQATISGDGDRPFGTAFNAFHAARTEVGPNGGNSPVARVMGILFPADRLMHEQDGGVTDAEASAAFPRVNFSILPALCVIDGNRVPYQR